MELQIGGKFAIPLDNSVDMLDFLRKVSRQKLSVLPITQMWKSIIHCMCAVYMNDSVLLKPDGLSIYAKFQVCFVVANKGVEGVPEQSSGHPSGRITCSPTAASKIAIYTW